jgi:sortase (surface protein transpeptidase)
MYLCKNCWNKKYFKETYQVDTIVTIEDWENVNSYDKQSDLIMVTCLDCNNNTEDESITDLEWNILLIN